MRAAPQHHRLPDTLLGGDTRQCGGLPGGRVSTPSSNRRCACSEETNYRSSLSPFGIKMVDRLTGKPLHLDISDLPMKRGITTNRNKFVLGPSGGGKSFFMNHLVRQYYEQGAHVVLVDTGNSYQGLCGMIRRKTGGADGVYFTYTEEKPIVQPVLHRRLHLRRGKKDSIKTLLLTLWKSEDDKVTKTESGGWAVP